MSEEQTQADNRPRPTTDQFREFVAQDWAPRPPGASTADEVAAYTPARRDALSQRFPGDRLVVPAGGLKVRSNDTDYVFRPHSAFVHLTGWAADAEPDAVLVLEPREDAGHDPVLYFRPMAPREDEEFFADPRYGEYWVGVRPTLEDLAVRLGIETRHLSELDAHVGKDAGATTVRLVRDADRELTQRLDGVRVQEGADQESLAEADDALAAACSILRLTKDAWEVGQMREAYGGRDATSKWFESASWISFAAINDPDTAEYISKRCGDTTVEVDQLSRTSQMSGSSRTRSKQLAARPLILPEEVLRMRGDEQIVFTAGNPPLRCGRGRPRRGSCRAGCGSPSR